MLLGVTIGMLFSACEWVKKLAYVNLLWILFSIAGLFFLGIMPATIALFTIVRKWQMEETDLPIWSSFVTVYRQEFKKSNQLGLCLSLAGAFIVLDFLYLQTLDGTLQSVMFVLLILFAGFFLITLVYIFPVYVHYEFKMIESVKSAFFLGVLHFHITILMVVGIAAIVYFMLFQPGLFPFFSAVSISWVLMIGGNYCFKQIETRSRRVIG